jgi:RsiW-degrading membrane proteinase PrsW (M82 family)
MVDYLHGFLRTRVLRFNLMYFIIAAFCAAIWFLFVRWWDLFDREPLGLCVLAVLLGAVASYGVLIGADVQRIFGLWGPSGSGFLFYWWSVGVEEEIAKFLPVIVIALTTPVINEPIDWMVYGCLSALGFSVWENYSYLVHVGLGVGIIRTFLSTPFHLAMTGSIALMIPEARRRHWPVVPAVITTLVAVALIHGTFDFLASREDTLGGLLSVALAFAWGEVFVRIMASADALSPMRRVIRLDHFSTLYWFIGSYALLCGIVFVMNATRVDHAEAIARLEGNLVPGVIAFAILRQYTNVFMRRVERSFESGVIGAATA